MTVEQMYEDFSADHANKTITMETHPHLPGPPQVKFMPYFKNSFYSSCRFCRILSDVGEEFML
jgi:Autophagocytosis associated protein, active-site domain